MDIISNLSQLPVGGEATIFTMPTGRAGLTRLREMGLTPGARVRVIRRSPVGEPLEILVRGSHLAMRNHEAADISINEVNSPQTTALAASSN